MKYLLNLIWAIIAVYLCQLSITNVTADKIIEAPEAGYRFETNRNILVENDNVIISTASCTKFSLSNQKASKKIDSKVEKSTPLGIRNCSPYYKITNELITIGLWEFTGGVSEYEISALNTSKITLIEPEVSRTGSRYAFYLLYLGIWSWMAIFTNLYFRKRD